MSTGFSFDKFAQIAAEKAGEKQDDSAKEVAHVKSVNKEDINVKCLHCILKLNG